MKLLPELRLFISVDIVGSTAYKQKRETTSDDIHPWYPVLHTFLTSFPLTLEEHLNDFLKVQNLSSIAPLSAWKYLGDEIIFTVALNHSRHLSYYIRCARASIKTYVEKYLKQEGLSLRGAAWLAGFPTANISFLLHDKGIEYLGRSMDIGFRLSTLANREKFALCVKTTWMLAYTSMPEDMYYGGKVPLKGVLDNRPYPFFWLDMGHSPSELVLSGLKTCSKSDVSSFTTHYIQSNGMGLPFIDGDTTLLENKPSDYQDRVAKVETLISEPALDEDEQSPDVDANKKSDIAKLINQMYIELTKPGKIK